MSILSTAVTSTCAVAYMSPASISRPPSYVQYALACPRDGACPFHFHVLGKMAGRALGRLRTATSRKENELAWHVFVVAATNASRVVCLLGPCSFTGRSLSDGVNRAVPLSSASVHRGRQPLVNYWARRSPPLKTRDPDGVDQGTRWQR
jgi:hypothetical protein